MRKTPENASSKLDTAVGKTFGRLLRKLVAVPKEELLEEERKYEGATLRKQRAAKKKS